MDKDFENVFTGTFVAAVVCIISGLLYYLFKHAALSPCANESQDANFLKKKIKKPDVKKAKKVKKKQTNGTQKADELELDKASDDNLDEEFTVEAKTAETEDREPSIPVQDSSLGDLKAEVSEADSSITVLKEMDDDSAEYFHVDDLVIPKNVQQSSLLNQPIPDLNRSSGDDSDTLATLKSQKGIPLEKSEISSDPSSTHKTKKSKRRSAKKQPSAIPELGTLVIAASDKISKPHVSEGMHAFPEPTAISSAKQINKPDDLIVSELRENIKQLQSELKASETKLKEVSQQSTSLLNDNKRLRSKEEEISLGLHVLQGQYTELLRTNKTLEHDKNTKDVKLKNLETEKCDLLKRLEHLNSDMIRVKTEAESEIRKLRDQLAETNSKMGAMAAAMTAAPPPGPSPELVRTQELAQAMSNDNRILKSRIEQLENERNQLHQNHVRQQQDIQVLKSENRKLVADKESALEDLMAKRQVEQADVNSRLASYEAQLRHRCHELEVEKQRNQEYATKLSEATEELQQVHDRDKQQSQIITSLEYQFSELNTEKQCLLEEIAQTKVMHEAATSQLRAELANLTQKIAELEQSRAVEVDVPQQLSSPSDLSGRVGDDSLTCVSSLVDNKASVVNAENARLIDELRCELICARNDMKRLECDAHKSRELYESTLEEMERYKTTLVETEDILQKLQKFARETELKWQEQLREKEADCDRLRSELVEATSHLSKENEVLVSEMGERPIKIEGQDTDHTQIIESLKYQFAELNTEKQCLLEEIAQTKVMHEAATSQLRAELANLTQKIAELEQSRAVEVDVPQQLSTPSDLSGRVGDDSLTCVSSLVDNKASVVNAENARLIDELRCELICARNDMKRLECDAQKSRELYESTLEEMEQYKNTLVETEEVLQKLQGFAQETELKWQQQLCQKEAICDHLRQELAEITSRVTQPPTDQINQAGSFDDSKNDTSLGSGDRELITFELADSDAQNNWDTFDSDAVFVNYS